MKATLGLSLVAAAGLVGCAAKATNMNTPGGTAGGSASPITGGASGTVGGTAGAGMNMTGRGTAGMSPVAPSPMAGGSGKGAGGTGAGGSLAMAGTSGGSGTTGGSGAGGSSVGGSGAGGASGTGGGAGTGGLAQKPPCIKKGSDVAFLGDSWVEYTESLPTAVTALARMDGALMGTDSYASYAVPGTSLGNGQIPSQWSDPGGAKSTMPKYVVMDGGGNDVLLLNPGCLADGSQNDQSCKDTVANATMVGMQMEADIKASGVSETIYFFYPHVPVGGHDILDYSLPMAKATCEAMSDSKYKCIFIDTRDAFDPSHTGTADASLIGFDSIHPNAQGEAVLSGLIWKTMKENCMGQSSSNPCCTP